jgi:predicted DNA-binding protein
MYNKTGGQFMLAIRLSEDTEARLENLAEATGRSKSFYARAAIDAYLQHLEDMYLGESLGDVPAIFAALGEHYSGERQPFVEAERDW